MARRHGASPPRPSPSGAAAQVERFAFTMPALQSTACDSTCRSTDHPTSACPCSSSSTSHSDGWEPVSVAFAAEGCAVVAVSPIAAAAWTSTPHAQDSRIFALAQNGDLSPALPPGPAVALGGSFSSPILRTASCATNVGASPPGSPWAASATPSAPRLTSTPRDWRSRRNTRSPSLPWACPTSTLCPSCATRRSTPQRIAAYDGDPHRCRPHHAHRPSLPPGTSTDRRRRARRGLLLRRRQPLFADRLGPDRHAAQRCTTVSSPSLRSISMLHRPPSCGRLAVRRPRPMSTQNSTRISPTDAGYAALTQGLAVQPRRRLRARHRRRRSAPISCIA